MNITLNSISNSFYITGLTFLLVNCSKTPQTDTDINLVNLSDKIGWLHGNCLAIKNSDNLEGLKLTIVNLDDPQEISHSIIIKKTSSAEDCFALLEDRAVINNDYGRNFYTVSSKKTIDLAIGIISIEKQSPNEIEVLDLNKDGRKNTFSYCSTSEGIQFNSWSGIAYKSPSIWSDYYYLAYDIEANCPVEDN